MTFVKYETSSLMVAFSVGKPRNCDVPKPLDYSPPGRGTFATSGGGCFRNMSHLLLFLVLSNRVA